MRRRPLLLSAIASACMIGSTWAAVSAEEAKRLAGPELTPWGSERAGNKAGTIPEWTGEAIKPPSDYDPKEPGRLPNPWKDKPLFTITPQNADNHKPTLTPGQTALLKKFPEFRMDVYQSRRPTRYPEYVIENTIKNATACKTVQNQLVLSGCYGGFPFPIPKTGNEVMWNHLARYTLHSWKYVATAATIDTAGKASITNITDSVQVSPFYDPANKGPRASDSIYWKLRMNSIGPARKVGEKVMLIDSLDMVNVGRRAYQYIPGQRRVKLAPDLAYDTPTPSSGGAMTMDQPQIFLGAQDRYDFKLIGKQERHIMANNYEVSDYKACPNEKWFATRHVMNPDCSRWELHRVWVLDAVIKPGFRHILPRRTMYFDEDTYGAGVSDDYDSAGKMYRVTLNPSFQIYNAEGVMSDFTFSLDLFTGIWNTSGMISAPSHGITPVKPLPDVYYSPEAMAAEGIR